MIFQKTWPLEGCVCVGVGGGGGGVLIFPIYLYRKLEKILSSETTGPISINFTEMFPW